MKGLRWKGGLVVAAAVIGFQWYVEANPTKPKGIHENSVISTAQASTTVAAALPVKTVAKRVDHTQNWFYHYQDDDLRHITEEYASNPSRTKHRFAFPYDNDTWLTIRTVSVPLKHKMTSGHPKVKDVFLTTNNGQFQCGYDGCYAAVSFDGGKVERFHLTMPNAYPNNVLYMIDGQRFLREMSKHKTAIIEVDYFQNGSQQFRFRLHDETRTTYSS